MDLLSRDRPLQDPVRGVAVDPERFELVLEAQPVAADEARIVVTCDQLERLYHPVLGA